MISAHFPEKSGNIPSQSDCVFNNEYKDWIIEATNEAKMKRAIFKLGKYKTPGIDNIYPIMLQESFELVAPALKQIYRFSLATGFIPNKLLEIRVIFIPKPDKDPYDSPKSYRPISLMSFLLKILEHLICFHLEDKIEALKHQQYAYRKNRSSIQALNDMISRIERQIRRGRIVWSAFIDVEGAFDKLQFDTITRVLRSHDIEEEIIIWVMTLLKLRSIYTNIAGVESRINPLKGVPQGSVIACRLWIFCMNELYIKNGKHTGLQINCLFR